MQRCFEAIVLGWVRRHPQRAVACRLESVENYIAQAFERFWQATAYNQQLEFRTLAAALQYLRASLHGAILDTLLAAQLAMSCLGRTGWLTAVLCVALLMRVEVFHDLLSNGFTGESINHLALEVKPAHLAR